MADSNQNPAEGFNKAKRHEHDRLCRFEGLSTYECSGCKEYGENVGYKCMFNDSSSPSSSTSCHNFTLHEACATLPDVYPHSLRGLFNFRPKTSLLRHHCDACHDVLKGFVFETERRHLRHEFRLHPLCMILPQTLLYSRHKNHELVLDDSELNEYTCNACEQIHSGGWRYRCAQCQFNVDLSCAKIDIYRLSVPRVAPISRSRRLMSKVSMPAKWFAKALVNVALQIAAGEIIQETTDRSSHNHSDRRNSGNHKDRSNNSKKVQRE